MPLPVPIAPDVLASRPHLAALLEMLQTEKRLTTEGLTQAEEQELESERQRLIQQRRTFLEKELLIAEMRNIIDEKKTPSSSHQSSRLDQAYNLLSDAMYTTHASQCLNIAEENTSNEDSAAVLSSLSLLGLNPSDFPTQPSLQLREAVQSAIVPEFDTRLRQRCESLVKLYNPSLATTNASMTIAKAHQLPAMIVADIAATRDAQQRAGEAAMESLAKAQDCAQALDVALQATMAVLNEVKLSSQPALDDATVRALQATTLATKEKLWLLIWQVMGEMYNKENIAALTNARRQQDAEAAAQTIQHKRIRDALQTYKSVGRGLEQLVSEYMSITDTITKLRWALENVQ